MSKQHSDDLKCEWIGEREKERNKGRAKKIQCKERKNNKKERKNSTTAMVRNIADTKIKETREREKERGRE